MVVVKFGSGFMYFGCEKKIQWSQLRKLPRLLLSQLKLKKSEKREAIQNFITMVD